MFFPRFIEELFKPQETYSLASTRQIFDRLAHSSIMRLNTQSMEKLVDLMLMGFKHQFLRCVAPEELLDVYTLRLRGTPGKNCLALSYAVDTH